MLCTKCSSKLKPVVALDIDGTLGDYHSHFLGFAEMWMGWNQGHNPPLHTWDDYDGSERFRDWFCTRYGVDLTTFREIKLAYRQGAQKRCMPEWPGTRTLAACLNGMNIEVWLTTTRPYLNLSGIDSDTRFWLDRLGLRYDHLLYDEDKYEVLCQRIDGRRLVAVVDDERAQLRALSSAFLKRKWPYSGIPILRRTRYNRAVWWGSDVAQSSPQVLELIAKKVQDWRVKNG